MVVAVPALPEEVRNVTLIAREGPRRAVLWATDMLVGLRTARHRVPRRQDVEGAVVHTMPNREEVEGALQIFRESFDLPSETRVLRRVAKVFPWACIVAVRDGTVEGYCWFRILPRRNAILLSMAVRPAGRGRGYGRAMLSFGLSVLRQSGIEIVDLDVEEGNEAAIRLYSSLGFSRRSVTPSRKVMRMRKAIGR